jgi:hypothetical protein
MILGMDPWVFAAWMSTILAALLCVAYGLYHEYIKKRNTPSHKKPQKSPKGKGTS